MKAALRAVSLGLVMFLPTGCVRVQPGLDRPMDRALNADEGEISGDPFVTFLSPCLCILAHGDWRWSIKTEPTPPPEQIPADHHLQPSDIGQWDGPGGHFNAQTPRRGREEEWYVVTGRIHGFWVASDGDLHIHLVDVRDPHVKLVIEVPLGETWCAIRKEAFSWTNVRFPFTCWIGRKLHLLRHPVVEVTGRAFYDADHAPYGDTRLNRRGYDSHLTVWEIHPVMKLRVLQ